MCALCSCASRLFFVNRSFLLIVCILLLAVPPAQSQTTDNVSRGHYLGLTLNGGLNSCREDLLVPLAFNGPTVALGGYYTFKTEDHVLDLYLQTGMGYLQNRFSHEAWTLMFRLRPSWLMKWQEDPSYGALWLGVSLPMQMNNLFIESWDDAHLYWLSVYNLALASKWQKHLTADFDVAVHLELPFAGWISRPPGYRYNKQDAMNHAGFHFSEPNTALQFETLDTYRALFLQMMLKKELPGSILNLGLEFHYNYCQRSRQVWILSTALVFSYQWRIGS